MKKSKFNQIVEAGIVENKRYLAVKIDRELNPGPEIVIYPAENFNRAVTYYNNHFDDDMVNFTSKYIGKIDRVTGAIMTNHLDYVQWLFMEVQDNGDC